MGTKLVRVPGQRERFHFRARMFVWAPEVKGLVFLWYFFRPHTQASSVLASSFLNSNILVLGSPLVIFKGLARSPW